MRIATTTFQQDATSQMQQLQYDLTQTQNQLATGKKVNSAADDPAGMAMANQMNVQLSASQQYVTNGNSASSSLQLEEQAMSDATNTMQSVRDLAVEAGNPALSAAQRADIASQMQQDLQNLVSIGNRTDGQGNYIFAGNSANTIPFSQSGTTVSYSGSNLVSQVQIAENQKISAGDSGSSVFMNIPGGNGTFSVAAGGTNTGTGSIGVGSVTNKTQWVPDNYTISFTSPTNYTVTDSQGNTVTTGTNFQDGDSIAFKGVSVPITGTPAAGDSFTVAQAGNVSAFATVQGLITTLNNPSLNSAQISSAIGNSLQQIDGSISNLNNVSASVGARVNAVTASQSTAQTLQTNLTASISKITDVDYASAITQLNTEEVSLQAAQESYASIAKLSLFNYLQG
jgi:flagellar hook-associated protein 3 FlgL